MKSLIHILLWALPLLCGAEAAAQTATSLFWRADSLQCAEIVSPQAVQYSYVGHHGPAVENAACALRLYFNDSGAIDVYSKRGPRMELLEYGWYPTEEQQAEEGAGADEFLVGRTLGLGGIALWDNGREVRLVATQGRTARVGQLRGGAFAEIVAHGVLYQGAPVDITLRVEMKDNSRVAKVIASASGGRKVQFVTGVCCPEGATVECGRNFISVWGAYPVDLSRTPCEVGAGMWFRPGQFVAGPEQGERFVRLISKPLSKLETQVVAASDKETELGSAEAFAAYLRK